MPLILEARTTGGEDKKPNASTKLGGIPSRNDMNAKNFDL
jgi:hypothetical protein